MHELHLDLAQLARPLLDARLERFVELRDLLEGLRVLDPDRDKASKAYENRAKLRRYLGQDELADADEKQAGLIDTWLDLFGGIFRFW